MSDLSKMDTQELLLEYIKYLTQAANARSIELRPMSMSFHYYDDLDQKRQASLKYNKAYQMMTVIQDILILRGFDSSFFEENRLE